jgi:uncharacterized membrane-anchored protein
MNKCPRRPSPLQTVAAVVASVLLPFFAGEFLPSAIKALLENISHILIGSTIWLSGSAPSLIDNFGR